MGAIRCAVAQFQHRANDKAYNLAVIERFSADAARRGAQIVAFPEMCVTGYWHVRNLDRKSIEALAEAVPSGRSVETLAHLAKRFGLAVGAGLIEQDEDDRLCNTYVVALPDGQVQSHRKLHAFENECISSGDRFTVFDTPWGVRAAILICWDNNLVENVRICALLGATCSSHPIRPMILDPYAFPVLTSPSSSPTPLLKRMKSPLSWAREGSQAHEPLPSLRPSEFSLAIGRIAVESSTVGTGRIAGVQARACKALWSPFGSSKAG
jgi:hypothetical protein